MKFILKDELKHQEIGGKEFLVDERITETLTNDEVFNIGMTGNYACHNFLERRHDFNRNFPFKLYYGKVNGLGYIIASDEIKTVIAE